MTTYERPERPAVVLNERGIPCYRPQDIALYRLLNGVSQSEAAARAGFTQQWAQRLESDRYGLMQARTADPLLEAVDRCVESREALLAEGRSRLEGNAPQKAFQVRGRTRKRQ